MLTAYGASQIMPKNTNTLGVRGSVPLQEYTYKICGITASMCWIGNL